MEVGRGLGCRKVRGPAWAVREGEFDPLWSRPPAPTLEAAVSVTHLPQVTCLVTTLEAAVSVTHLPQVTCLATCVGHQAKAPQLFFPHAATVFVAFWGPFLQPLSSQ